MIGGTLTRSRHVRYSLIGNGHVTVWNVFDLFCRIVGHLRRVLVLFLVAMIGLFVVTR